MALITIRELDGSVIQGLGNFNLAPAMSFKRGTTPQIGIQFSGENGQAVPLPAGAVLTLGIKPSNPNNTAPGGGPGTPAFDGAYTMSGTTSAGPDENNVYWLAISFSTAALNTLLGFDPPTINDDVPVIELFAEVAWSYYGATVVDKSATFDLEVYHDINTGTEGANTAANTGSDTNSYLNSWSFITALAGGGATELDYQPTLDTLAPGTVILMEGLAGVNGGGATLWQLQTRTDATAAGTLQRPLDFNAATNPVVWVKIL